MSKTVCLHAWYRTDEGDETYSDGDSDPVDGYCVYLRVDKTGPDHPFDIDSEADFDTYEQAADYASTLCEVHGCGLFEY